MFNLDIFGNPQSLSISLCRPDDSLLGSIDDIIDDTSASLTVGLNQQYELSFDITKKGNDNWFDYVVEGMELYVDKIGLFKINQPPIELDGTKEKKTVTAYSIESELEDKELHFNINMGEENSQEFLVTYEDGETETLINPYTGIPYDWILLYNTLPEQLTVFKNKLDAGYYGSANQSGDINVTNTNLINELTDIFNLVPRLKNKITYTDNQDGSQDSVLTEYVIITKSDDAVTQYTLTNLFSSRVDQLITYYTKYRKQLSLLDIVCAQTNDSWSVGEIYGLSNGDYTVANKKLQFEINETIYSFLTQSLPTPSDYVVTFDKFRRKINVTPVDKIGNDTGIMMDYDNLVNTLNIDTDDDRLTTRISVSGGNLTDIEKVNFGSLFVDDIMYKLNAKDSNGKRIYVSDDLAEKYMDYIDWREEQRTRYVELAIAYEEYNEQISEIKNRVPLDSLKNDYSTFSMEELQGELTAYKNLLATLKSLYKEEFYPQGLNQDGSIKESYIKNTAYWFDYVGYQYTIKEIQFAIEVFPNYNDHTEWSSGDTDKYKNQISAWETEWSLYGTVELEAKIATYKNNMDSLAQKGVIRSSDTGYQIKTWSQLSAVEKSEYLTEASYHYDEYMENYNNMISAQAYLDTLLTQIEQLKTLRDAAYDERVSINEAVKLENNFTPRECIIINRLYRDSSYSNDNIIGTDINSVKEIMDLNMELLEDAKDQISILSRPQLTFSVEADNLLGIKTFEPFWKQFIPGNYIYVQYKDNKYVKLRMISYTFNPCLPSSSDLSIEFSNFVKSRSYYRDWASLLGNDSGSGGSSGGSSGGGSGGAFGTSDDIDITISNTMLAKLLNTETFGTRVTDVILDTIDANAITARNATFGGLANGTTTIDGQCLQTGWIISKNYNGNKNTGTITNTQGSILRIEDGTFNFAGGKFKATRNTSITPNTYTVEVDGTIKANEGRIGGSNGWIIAENTIYSGTKDSGTSSGDVTLSTVDFSRAITGFTGNRTGLRFAIGGNFAVTNSGVIYASGANIAGTLTAGSGSKIGPWNITDTSIYKVSSTMGNSSTGAAYFGNNGLSITNKFQVDASGNLTSTGNFSFGGTNGIVYDGTNVTLGSKCSISWDDVTGTSDIATKDYVSTTATKITKDTVTTTYVNALNVKAGSVDAENITGTTITGKTLSGGSITIGSNFSVNNQGVLNASGATVNGTLTAGSGSSIGPWTVANDYIRNGNVTATSTNVSGVYLGKDGINVSGGTSATTAYFTKSAVNIGGKLSWNGTTLSVNGTITASGGSITGGLTIGSNGYFTTNASRTTYDSTSATGITITSSGIGGYGSANSYFTMTTGGKLTCTGADITGEITANTGKIGGTNGWSISNGQLSIGTLGQNGSMFLSTLGNYAYIGTDYVTGLGMTIGSNFGVSLNGDLYAKSGKIGDWSINNGMLDATTTDGSISLIPSQGIYFNSQVANQHATSYQISHGSGFLMDDLTASHRTWIKPGVCSVSSNTYTGNVINVDAQVSSPCVTIETTRLVDTYASVKNSGAWGRLLASPGSRFGLYNMTSGYEGWLIYCDSTGKVKCNDGTTLSDIRMKDNIKNTDINNARQIVDKFKIRQFDWIRDGEHQDIGFIADELEQIDAHLAFGGGFDEFGNMNTKHIDTLYLLGYLTKAFQELSAEVTSLRNEIKQLKSER